MYLSNGRKGIVDFSIYVRNTNFRIPGSSKAKNYHRQALPSRSFFIRTRMADREGIPEMKATQLIVQRKVNIQIGRETSWNRQHPLKTKQASK